MKTAEHARAIAAGADAVVVGSALVEAIRSSLDEKGEASARTVPAVRDLVASLAAGVRGRKTDDGGRTTEQRVVNGVMTR